MYAQGQRLAAFREQAGYDSARAAAIDNGWAESSYRAHENGTRTIGQDDAEKYATKFRQRSLIKGITAKAILFGPEAASTAAADDFIQVPLLSWTAAGKLADNSVEIPDDTAQLGISGLGRGHYFALKVQGDAMDRVSPEGAIIIVDRDGKPPLDGKPYVFAHDGKVGFGIWRQDPPRLVPASNDLAAETTFIKSKRDLAIIGRVRRSIVDF
jgi:SOS-response transcriptional repressor LexA